MTQNRDLLLMATGLAAISFLLPRFGIASNGLALVLWGANLFVSYLGFRTGNYRPFWLTWATLTVVGFILFGVTGPLSLLMVAVVLVG
ncbi:hypothetical protein [Peteryoungia ipomoeae]|uniref:Uncharacterized protein n=1 Tax=Peteryoungia ipomoeae TaxID=1210932 RepID=A0A4S8P6V4_9HYPH|nr:hypothetical protein [Peteryoungia ipomoeae]THV25065.1 hypothetical protein FAA97_02330 [Peteryoungia ipomoeae]